MAIFGTSTKKGEQKAKKDAVMRHAKQAKPRDGQEHDIVRAPWLSEKALLATEKGVYVFEVPKTATKADIAGAVKAIYKVDAKKIRVVNLPAKSKSLRTRRGEGFQASRRKAYVYLNADDTIQLA